MSQSAKSVSVNLGRGVAARRLGAWPVQKIVQKLGTSHLRRGYAQLAMLAFDHISSQIVVHGKYESLELQAFDQWLRANCADSASGIAIDVGANIGNHSVHFADHFAQVISFEPNPPAFELLKINARLRPNIQCHNLGLSDRSSAAAMITRSGNLGGTRLSVDVSSPSATIRVQPLDSLGPFPLPIRLVKIDVEGHEEKVIRGAEGILRQHRPVVLFEQHASEIFGGTSATIRLLRSFGYTRFVTIETGLEGHDTRFHRIFGRLAMLRHLLIGYKVSFVERAEFPSRNFTMILALSES